MKKVIKKYYYFFLIFIIFISLIIVFSSCSLFNNFLISRKDYDALKSDYDKVIKDYQLKKNELEFLSKENKNLKNEINEMEEQIEGIENEIEILRQQILEKNKEISNLKDKLKPTGIKSLEEEVLVLQKQKEKLKRILDNLNDLLKYVYIGSAAPDSLAYTFTAFSISYKSKFYIITAGHCVQDNYGKEGSFKFKANFSDEWIYPTLLDYKAEFWNLDDYGVFYSDKVISGLPVSDEKTEDFYLLGSIDKGLSIFRNLGDSSRRGESGSPVINENGQVVGIYVVYGLVYTPIQLALEVIDKK